MTMDSVISIKYMCVSNFIRTIIMQTMPYGKL